MRNFAALALVFLAAGAFGDSTTNLNAPAALRPLLAKAPFEIVALRVEHNSGGFIATESAFAFGPAKRETSGLCRGPALLYISMSDEWSLAPMQVSYVTELSNKNEQCGSPGEKGILLMGEITNPEVVAILKTVRAATLCPQPPGWEVDTFNRSARIDVIVQQEPGDVKVRMIESADEEKGLRLIHEGSRWCITNVSPVFE